MLARSFRHSLVVALLAALTGISGIARATTPSDQFHRAYYLDVQEGDWATAAKLYEQALTDKNLEESLQHVAKARLAVCREELAAQDFARLVPPNTLAYAEFSRPGAQLERLLGQLGLLTDPSEPVQPGEGETRVAISPALIRELTGMRGAAVAVTGFDFIKQEPTGVLIVHPGNLEVVRGFLETGLPIGGTAVEPILGHATYDIEGDVLVTLTSRLIVASPSRNEIKGVVRRLMGKETSCLADSSDVAEELAARGDSMVFFCLNARPVMTIANTMLAAAAQASPEAAVARVALDPESLRSIVGKAGVSDDGLFLDLILRLADGHQNLLYNFLRTPPIHRETLRGVPAGAAVFLASALNDPPTENAAVSDTGGDRIVTALDFGRELFANLTSFALFALAPEEPGTSARKPVPDVGAVLTVNDPSKSELLWTQMLGLASLATGRGAVEGVTAEIAGTTVRTFQFPDGIKVYLAISGNDVMIASSESTMKRSLRAKQSGESVLDDPTFASTIDRITASTTKAIYAHPGRIMKIAANFDREAAEANQQIGALLDNTIASFVVAHARDRLHIGLNVTGLPDVGPFVTQQLVMEKRKQSLDHDFRSALKSKNWNKALTTVDEILAAQPDNLAMLENRCRILSYRLPDADAARACFADYYAKAENHPQALNNFAWALLTDDRFKEQWDDVALKMSLRCNDLTKQKNWRYVDTLALAKFRNGLTTEAIELQKKAIALAGGNASDAMSEALARFEQALGAEHVAQHDE